MDSISEVSIDAPVDDVVEQARPVTPEAGLDEEDSAATDELTEPVVEADEYDAAEQNRVVEIDEDEYR